MAHMKSTDNSFADLVARLNAMSNITPDQERAELMEAANKEPKILDDKDISLADIAKLAGIKEYTDAPKVSKKAQKMVESITKEPKVESGITKAISNELYGGIVFKISIRVIMNIKYLSFRKYFIQFRRVS